MSTGRRVREPRRQTEAGLLQQGVDALSDIFYMMNPVGELMRWNRAVKEVTGYSDDELEGMELSQFFPEGELETVQEAFNQAIETGSAKVETGLLTAQGETIPYEFTGSRVTDDDGNVQGVIGIGRDITEQKQREENLHEQRSFLEALIEASVDGVLLTNFQWETLYHNERFLEIWDLSRELLDAGDGKAALDEALEMVADPDAFTEMIENLYEHPEQTLFEEVGLTDGRTLNLYSTAVMSEAVQFGRIWMYRDITELKDQQRELERRNEQLLVKTTQLDAILFHTTRPMFMKTRTGEYILANREYQRLFDLEEMEILGKTDFDLHPKTMAEDVWENDRQVLETGEPMEIEERIIVDGEERIYLSSKVPVYYEVGTDEPDAVFGMATDVTQRKAHENELERLNHQLEEALQAKDRLMGEIHHRVKNNFQVASSMLGLQRRATDNQETQQILRDVQSRIQSMVSLHRILYQQENVDRVNMKPYLEAIIESVRENLSQSEFPVSVHRKLAEVSLSPDRALHLGLILTELLMDSFEHAMPHTKKGKITVRFEETDRGLLLSMQDNGPGFEEDLDELSSKSFGLRIVKALAVDQLGGSFSADGSEGAYFEIRFSKQLSKN